MSDKLMIISPDDIFNPPGTVTHDRITRPDPSAPDPGGPDQQNAGMARIHLPY